MTKPVCAVVGIGPGNGTALARAFAAGGYRVVLLSRTEANLAELSAQIADSAYYLYDAADPASAETVLPRIAEDLGPIETLVYNAGSGVFGSLDDVSLADFEMAWRINSLGLLAAAKQVTPAMVRAGHGNLVVIGATSAVKHSPGFAAFTSAKASQRALAMSMAKHLGPKGVHVSYVIVDGVIDIPRTRRMIPDRPDEFFLKAEDIARTVTFLCQQPSSAWTFEVDVRPFGEKW